MLGVDLVFVGAVEFLAWGLDSRRPEFITPAGY